MLTPAPKKPSFVDALITAFAHVREAFPYYKATAVVELIEFDQAWVFLFKVLETPNVKFGVVVELCGVTDDAMTEMEFLEAKRRK